MKAAIDNRKGFYTESKVLENIKESVDDLKKQLVENGYDDEFINEVVNSFKGDYIKIMNFNVEEVFDLLKNKSNSLDWKYKWDDFIDKNGEYDEDTDECYLDILNHIIIDYALYPIHEMIKDTEMGYEIKFYNGEKVRVAFRHNYKDITPLKELYYKHINLDNDIENKPSLKL